MSDNIHAPYNAFSRPVLDQISKAYLGDDPALIAVHLAALHGIHIFPTHGMRKAATETGVECECLKGRRKWAECGDEPMQPCPQPGKLPRIKDWPTNASTDPETIAAWHRRWPLTNFSAVTGPVSNVWILDIDGALGFASLAEVLAKTGPLPATWQTQSGSGDGAHFWFGLPDGVDIRNSASQIAPGVDVRGYNGQILLPGSLHKSGNRYRFTEGHAPHEVALAHAPQPLVDLALDACLKTRRDRLAPRPVRERRTASMPVTRTQQAKSLLIGDGEGRGGFHDPINRIAVKHFGQHGAEIDVNALKAALRQAVLTAPADNHRPDEIQRYASDQYLDEAIESARQYILKGGHQMD